MLSSAAVFLKNPECALVACNLYVSAGSQASIHAPLLTNFLKRAQHDFWNFDTNEDAAAVSKISSSSSNRTLRRGIRSGAVVHAYVDPGYNRSSFHLAGNVEIVARVATNMAVQAVTELRKLPRTTISSCKSAKKVVVVAAHPNVGLVDHVSVMPLSAKNARSTTCDDKVEFASNESEIAAATWAAKLIGNAMQDQLGIRVYFYGAADHLNYTPLATVRREKTQFFHSGGLSNDGDETQASSQQQQQQHEVAIVGTPTDFVENYNILLNSQCTRKLAQSLTRKVRERDGGLQGVEALTLPYSDNRWEVACNLLQPEASGASDVQALVNQWESEQGGTKLVERGYRVGTTAEQCLQVLDLVTRSVEDRQVHDKQVLNRFISYFDSES